MHFSKVATLLFALALVGGGSACGGSSDGDGTGGSGGAGGIGGAPGTGGSGGAPGTGGTAGNPGTGGDGGGSPGTGGVGGDGGGSSGTGGVGGDGGGSSGTGGSGGSSGTGGAGGGMGGSGGGAPSASDCNAACTGYASCGWMSPSLIPVCSAECMGGTVDEVTCVLSAVSTCDGDAVDLCFTDVTDTWCAETCAEIGACSENPAAAEAACLEQCYSEDWPWDPQLAACLESAAPSCNMSAVNACFTWDDPACTAACNHVYYGCGLTVTDFFGAMDRFECQLYCEWDEWPVSQLQCLTNAACTTTAIDACIP